MKLHCRDRVVEITRPLIMGIVNATPDSFSDGGDLNGVDAVVARALDLIGQGADVIDIGGQSAITGVPEISIADEIDRVLPAVIGLRRASPDCFISVDTYRADVAIAVLDAGADIINDVSGLLDGALGDVIARFGAGYVFMHTRWKPKTRHDAVGLYDHAPRGVVGDVHSFLGDGLQRLAAIGIDTECVILDPGPDFSKTPHQTVEVLRALPDFVALGRPLLLALSRKDFIGWITERAPRERLAGTLGAVAATVAVAPSTILRVHDVAAVRDFLAVLDVLENRAEIPADAILANRLRWQSGGARS